MEEEWKDVAGYEGLYQVSDMGRVKSFYHDTAHGRILKPGLAGDGYLTVALCLHSEQTSKKVHRLVAEAFLERPSPDHDEVNHRDGDKLNNQSKNLQWVTRSENIRHSVQVLGNVPLPIDNRGEKHGQSKLTDRKVRQIRKLSTTGKYTQAELAEMFGVMQSAISRIVNHKLWKHIP